MKNFNTAIRVAPTASNCNTTGEIKLATFDADKYVNLITSDRNLTISADEAKKLRDLLNETYPLEVAKPSKFKVGDKVTYKSIVGYGVRGMEGRKGSIKEVLANEWYMVNFSGGPFDNLIKVHSDYLVAGPAPTVGGFKVGDRIRRLQGIYKGQVFTVTELNASLTELKVDGMAGWRMPKYFEPATEAPEPAPAKIDTGRFIVVALEGANYVPGSKPKLHVTDFAAKAEAERLAKDVGGTYHVFRAVFEASREKPVIPPVKTTKL
ncbi:hypothetical protein SAMN02927900_04783 [Rhizobium mongolense subsp. loessense]|uniref:Uncharacterized protein n=1 Tax=Rhizobium mongolense subsp. loessense TaxID=158890 RepID=A0A1G4T7D0_9HYPH|nr:hypothetical protein [Rhizobium mongolense]SCW77206.1 hypothetical protein SAMN02927900_04783 [Rhizobium mongolense subsp. loessense]